MTHTLQTHAEPAASSTARRAHGYRGRRRHRDPRLHALFTTVLFVGCIVLSVLAIGAHAKSAFTQSHGISRTATVETSSNNTSCSRSSCTTTFSADVTLQGAVDGHAATTVQGNGSFPYVDGDQITVLVDPHDPTYAELPGDERHSGGEVLVCVLVTVFFGVLAFGSLWRLFRVFPGYWPSRLTTRH